MAEFKKLSDVNVIESMKDGLNVLVEDAGEVVKLAANSMIPEGVALKSDVETLSEEIAELKESDGDVIIIDMDGMSPNFTYKEVVPGTAVYVKGDYATLDSALRSKVVPRVTVTGRFYYGDVAFEWYRIAHFVQHFIADGYDEGIVVMVKQAQDRQSNDYVLLDVGLQLNPDGTITGTRWVAE